MSDNQVYMTELLLEDLYFSKNELIFYYYKILQLLKYIHTFK